MTKTELKNELGKIYCLLAIIHDPNPAVSGVVYEIKEHMNNIFMNYIYKDVESVENKDN